MQNTEYFTNTIVTMLVAEDGVGADILVNKGGSSMPHAPRDTTFCESLYKSSGIVLPLILSIGMS